MLPAGPTRVTEVLVLDGFTHLAVLGWVWPESGGCGSRCPWTWGLVVSASEPQAPSGSGRGTGHPARAAGVEG